MVTAAGEAFGRFRLASPSSCVGPPLGSARVFGFLRTCFDLLDPPIVCHAAIGHRAQMQRAHAGAVQQQLAPVGSLEDC